jgi:hypothetical protein
MCNVNQNFYRENKMSEGIRTYLLTYSLEHSLSWEAYIFSASQEIPRILWNLKVHYRIHKCPPLVQIRDTCSCFVTKSVFTLRRCQHLAQPPNWRTRHAMLRGSHLSGEWGYTPVFPSLFFYTLHYLRALISIYGSYRPTVAVIYVGGLINFASTVMFLYTLAISG